MTSGVATEQSKGNLVVLGPSSRIYIIVALTLVRTICLNDTRPFCPAVIWYKKEKGMNTRNFDHRKNRSFFVLRKVETLVLWASVVTSSSERRDEK